MALTKANTRFSVFAVQAISRTTFLPYGKPIHAHGDFNLNPQVQSNSLRGGGGKHTIQHELGGMDLMIPVTVNEFPSWLYTLAGYSVTENSAEAGGSVNNFANKKGTSVVSATTGITTASVKSGSEADLKPGLYMVQAATTTTVDVYKATDFASELGADLSIVNDTMKITSSALTITTDTAVTIPNTGVELTGGSGTIGMTAGDIAWFEVRQINDNSFTIEMPKKPLPVEFTGLLYTDMQNDGSYQKITLPKCVIMPFNLNNPKDNFGSSDIEIHVLDDESETKLFTIEDLKG